MENFVINKKDWNESEMVIITNDTGGDPVEIRSSPGYDSYGSIEAISFTLKFEELEKIAKSLGYKMVKE